MSATEHRPDALPPVELAHSGDGWALIFTRDFPQRPGSVWAALTDPDELRRWAPYTADRPLTEPGPVTLLAIDGAEQEEMPGRVTRAEPPALLEFTWGEDTLRWELTGTGTGTRLRLTHRLSERATAGMMAAGWHQCLDVVDSLLAGTPVGPITGSAALDHGWSDLNARYSERLGLEVMEPPLPE